MAAIEPVNSLEPTSATEQSDDELNQFDDPEHPKFWIEKFIRNPAYQGPADLATNKHSQVDVMTNA